MLKPRELDDLPYFSYLDTEGGTPDPEDEYNTALFSGIEFDDANGGKLRFTQSAFSVVNFGTFAMRRSRFDEVWLGSCQLNGTDLAETFWLDAELVTSVLGGTALFDSELTRVNLFGCKLVGTNFRGATLREVAFVNCVLQDVNFADATLNNVIFPGSRISSLYFDRVQASKVDFTEAAELHVHSGHGSLRGTKINISQLMDLAPAFAETLGVIVDQ